MELVTAPLPIWTHSVATTMWRYIMGYNLAILIFSHCFLYIKKFEILVSLSLYNNRLLVVDVQTGKN
jgi:hypothetical protein